MHYLTKIGKKDQVRVIILLVNPDYGHYWKMTPLGSPFHPLGLWPSGRIGLPFGHHFPMGPKPGVYHYQSGVSSSAVDASGRRKAEVPGSNPTSPHEWEPRKKPLAVSRSLNG